MTSLVLMFIGGYAWCKAWTAIRDFLKNPYQYYCPESDCNFQIKGNDKDFIEMMKSGHIEDHRKG